MAALHTKLAITSGSVAQNEVPVLKDYESSSTSTVNENVPSAPLANRLTTAPADDRALPPAKRVQVPKSNLVDFGDLPKRTLPK